MQPMHALGEAIITHAHTRLPGNARHVHLLSPVWPKQACFPPPPLPCVLFINASTAGLTQGFGVGAAAVGATISAYALARLMMNLPAGMLADSHGRKPLLVWGPAITALGELIVVWMSAARGAGCTAAAGVGVHHLFLCGLFVHAHLHGQRWKVAGIVRRCTAVLLTVWTCH